MTYDQYGNIATKNGIVYGYDTDWNDKLISYNGKTFVYDENGNPTTYQGRRLRWEKGRQLDQYGTVRFKYNNEGIRIYKSDDSAVHTYVLDGTNIVKEIVTDICNCPKYINEYLYDLDGTVCGLKYNGTAYYFYKNLQGDVIAITDDTGATIARYTYDAWGKCTVVSDNSGVGIATINPFRYRSYYYDTETELYYLQSRYYNPEVGRFLNADSIKNISIDYNLLSCNLYVYCGNNPINEKDESGHGILTTVLSWALGLIIGIVVQFVSDIIVYLFEKAFKKTTDTFSNKFSLKNLKYEDYIASALSWAFLLINPFYKWKYVDVVAGLMVAFAKHFTRLLVNRFDFSDMVIDFGLVLIGALFSKFLDKSLNKKIKKITAKIDPNDVIEYLNQVGNIQFKFSGLGFKFAFAFTISPTFLQAICNNIWK